MTDNKSLLASARRRAYTLRMKLAGAERAVKNSRHELALSIAEKKVTAYTNQLAKVEAEIQSLETLTPQEVAFVTAHEVTHALVDVLDPITDDDVDTTIPPFLRRD